MDHLAILSSLLGLIYFVAWSLSFYPQPLHNFRRRSTHGNAIAYPILNTIGFTAYTIYTAVFTFSPEIRAQYAARHPHSPTPSVSPWDFAFAAHGWVFVSITMTQFWSWLWGFNEYAVREDGGQEGNESIVEGWKASDEESRVSWGVMAICGSGIAGILGVCLAVVLFGKDGGRDASGWAYIDIIYSFSTLKLWMTFFKYIPQVVYNARRRSTAGWAMGQVLLDFTGGVASVLQLFVDAIRFAQYGHLSHLVGHAKHGHPRWVDGVDGNIAKFWLGNVSMMFDIVFMVQHYILYPKESHKSHQPPNEEDVENENIGTERQPLLGDSRNN